MKQKVTLLVFAFALTLSLHATSSVSMSNDTIISSFGGIIPPPAGTTVDMSSGEILPFGSY